jgi:hypothetical protein
MSISNLFGVNQYDLNAKSIAFGDEPLNKYDENAVIATFSGALNTTSNVRLTRVGRMVFVSLLPFGGGTLTAGILTSDAVIPVDLRPAQSVSVISICVVGANQVSARFTLLNTGNFQVTNSAVSGANLLYGQNFPNATAISTLDVVSFVYNV